MSPRRWLGIQYDCEMGGDPNNPPGGRPYRPCWHWFAGWFPEGADRLLTNLSLWMIHPRWMLVNWRGWRQWKKALKAGDDDTRERLGREALAQYREAVKRREAKEGKGE